MDACLAVDMLSSFTPSRATSLPAGASLMRASGEEGDPAPATMPVVERPR